MNLLPKHKVVIWGNDPDEDGFSFESKCRGEEGLCISMALGFACELAKENGMALTTLKNLLSDIYKEKGVIDDGKN